MEAKRRLDITGVENILIFDAEIYKSFLVANLGYIWELKDLKRQEKKLDCQKK
jgi:hypothetical protein